MTSSTGSEQGPSNENERPLRALVVDDSAPVRELVVINLELEGFEVRAAEDGQQGVDAALDWRPDVITMDVMMPGLDGFDALHRLRTDPTTAGIPVVMLTGRAQRADRIRGDALGADAYLSKPFEPAELVAVARDLARNGRTGGQEGKGPGR
ncbi:MAG TPA: response regulator [Nocardioidaceae bacterium]|nr:response regulator [Nocardioidaceae bacterium]